MEGYWRSHQVPLAKVRDNPAHLKQLEEWLRSYRPEELFDAEGRLLPELKAPARLDDRTRTQQTGSPQESRHHGAKLHARPG